MEFFLVLDTNIFIPCGTKIENKPDQVTSHSTLRDLLSTPSDEHTFKIYVSTELLGEYRSISSRMKKQGCPYDGFILAFLRILLKLKNITSGRSIPQDQTSSVFWYKMERSKIEQVIDDVPDPSDGDDKKFLAVAYAKSRGGNPVTVITLDSEFHDTECTSPSTSSRRGRSRDYDVNIEFPCDFIENNGLA